MSWADYRAKNQLHYAWEICVWEGRKLTVNRYTCRGHLVSVNNDSRYDVERPWGSRLSYHWASRKDTLKKVTLRSGLGTRPMLRPYLRLGSWLGLSEWLKWGVWLRDRSTAKRKPLSHREDLPTGTENWFSSTKASTRRIRRKKSRRSDRLTWSGGCNLWWGVPSSDILKALLPNLWEDTGGSGLWTPDLRCNIMISLVIVAHRDKHGAYWIS